MAYKVIDIRLSLLNGRKKSIEPASLCSSKIVITLHLLCFISNAVPERPVDKSQNFDGVAYIA